MDCLPYEVRWELASDDQFGQVVQTGTGVASPVLAHSVHVDVTGLTPATEYFYRFMVGGEISPVGRTRTAPADGTDVDSVRFALRGCARWEHGYFKPYGHIAEQRFDVIFNLGDYIYEMSSGDYSVYDDDAPRRFTGGEIVDLSLHRNRHALYKTDADLQAAHRSAPWVVTWDDHEVENDYAGLVREEPRDQNGFPALVAASYQAYYEHMPLRPSSIPTGPDMQLYRAFRYGTLLDVAMLDGREYRSDQPCGDGAQVRCLQALDPAMTRLGPAQEQWVLATLDASAATWKSICQQTMMAQLNVSASEPTFNLDQWDGYPDARNRLLQHIDSRSIANTVVLSGDIHCAKVNDFKMDFKDATSTTVATEFVCTSLNADNPLVPQLQQALLINPHIRFVDGLHGYNLNTLTMDSWRSDFRTVPNVTDESAGVSTPTSWVISAGRAGAEEA